MDAASETALISHLGEVRGYLAGRCRDIDLAEELTQEVAARVSLKHPRLETGGNIAGYLVRVAQNVWRDWLRRELVRRRAAAALLAAPGAPSEPADAGLLARELQAGLRRAIDTLPAAQRQVVMMRHHENLTFQEIADRLDRPLGTILTQMRAALHRMQDTMKEFR